MKKTALVLLGSMLTLGTQAQQVIPLYDFQPIPNQAPNAPTTDEIAENDGILRIRNVTKPTLTVYKPAKPNGTAIIICPGGGYYILAAGHEGSDVAKTLNDFGVTTFVLKYRLPTTENLFMDKETGPLTDAQQAIRLVRSRAVEFGIRPDKIGVMGFSAGGHLASTAGTHFEHPVGNWPGRSTVSVRPDFLVLLYPVISFAPGLAHGGSRDALLGKNASPEKIDLYSNEKQVTKQTPPAFLVHAADDGGVPVENSVEFFLACKRNGVPAELHIYPKGGHGFGMNNPTTPDKWTERLKNWLTSIGM
ncbi:alpha/beta hydrolase [Siphonobacter aquaeclarae]|uniref:Acetyl esterase/lipase n=1 Tax=Siphonobacter aquaeclarae TaxID=563176 RepID=A0A1G9KGD9_9BACT|nr:alpha/beta hydrolase [Siphonobacter aquaeclarae]SDL48682.1 Acetyl esterase/lipase [Siphonobacter aquaeclarae]